MGSCLEGEVICCREDGSSYKWKRSGRNDSWKKVGRTKNLTIKDDVSKLQADIKEQFGNQYEVTKFDIVATTIRYKENNYAKRPGKKWNTPLPTTKTGYYRANWTAEKNTTSTVTPLMGFEAAIVVILWILIAFLFRGPIIALCRKCRGTGPLCPRSRSYYTETVADLTAPIPHAHTIGITLGAKESETENRIKKR